MLNAIAGAAYIGAGLGPGPRDGLMTGLVRITGRGVGVIRTSIEVSVLAIGFVLGGTVGLGTVVYALSIGPLLQSSCRRSRSSRRCRRWRSRGRGARASRRPRATRSSLARIVGPHNARLAEAIVAAVTLELP